MSGPAGRPRGGTAERARGLWWVVASLAAVGCALVAWWPARGGVDALPERAVEPELSARARAELSPRAATTDGDADEILAARALHADARTREMGILPPPPDTLAAVRGRVLDERTGASVPDFQLVFLSRRPRTTRAKTDANGRFETPVELASGVVSIVHVPDPDSQDKRARWTLEPSEFLLPLQGPADPPFEITITAKSPETVFEVEVAMPDGTPAEGASVALTSGRRDARHEFVPLARSYEVTDPRGRARFALFDLEALALSYRLEADHGTTLTSELVEIDPPLGTRAKRLDLAVGGAIDVRVQNDEGRPLSGVSLWLSTHESARFVTGRAGRSDATGACRFEALRSGCWTLSAIHPLTGAAVHRLVDLERGSESQLTLVLPVRGLRRAIDGRVVDEEGRPLPGVSLILAVPDEDPVRIQTDDAGRFEMWARPASGVSLLAGGGFLDDRFDPAHVTMPFGATGLEIRRVERFASETRAFLFVDAASGHPAARANLLLYHGASNANLEDSVLQVAAARGFVQATFKPRADLRYVIDAPGFVRAEGRVAELAEESGPAPLPMRVELERGFGRSLDVRDRATRRPIAGASFHVDTTRLGVSDGDGRVVLRSPAWPASIRIEAPGYVPLAWDPAAAEARGNVVWLEPVR